MKVCTSIDLPSFPLALSSPLLADPFFPLIHLFFLDINPSLVSQVSLRQGGTLITQPNFTIEWSDPWKNHKHCFQPTPRKDASSPFLLPPTSMPTVTTVTTPLLLLHGNRLHKPQLPLATIIINHLDSISSSVIITTFILPNAIL